MSGRCRACNVVLNEEEMTMRIPETGDYTDLCFRCLGLAEEGEEDFFDFVKEEE